MAVSVHKPTKFFCLTIFKLSVGASCCNAAYGEENPVAVASRAFCFNNSFYNKCGEEYKYGQSGYLNVPSHATDDYCQGPCLREIQSLLNCLDDMFSGFLFLNRASVPDIRNTLRAGCSYTTQRGIFDVGNYLEGGYNSSNKLQNSISFSSVILCL